MPSTNAPGALTHHKDPFLIAIALMGCLCVAGTLITLWNARVSWMRKDEWIWAKVGDSAIALACVVFIAFALYWHMISFNLNY
jgi:hypothetical protein